MPPEENPQAERPEAESLETVATPADQAPPAPNQPTQQTPPTPEPGDNSSDVKRSPAADSGHASPSRSLPRRLFGRGSIYVWIFGACIILVALLIYVLAIRPTKSNGSAKKITSLTDAQIAQFKNTATIVGTSKQTLDVQSNAIFDNQVLLRADLSVAGAIKSGGAGSFQSINIGGTGDFSDIHINNSLGVVGNTTFQGQLSVQKNLAVSGTSSLGTVTASQLTVGNLVLNGDVTLAHHLNTTGGIPGHSGGTALGSGGTASISGNDTAGSIAINTGSGTVVGILVNVTFTARFASTPHVIVTPIGSSAAGLSYYVSRTNTGFSIGVNNVPPQGASFGFDYIVIN